MTVIDTKQPVVDDSIEIISDSKAEGKALDELIGSSDEESEGYDILEDVFELKRKRSSLQQAAAAET